MNTVLIVDDDALYARLLAGALARHGFAVHTAADAAQALAAARAHVPEGVVLDLRLAAGSGLELLPPLRAQLPGARIVLLTGYASIATAVQATRLGADAYLPKPVTAEELLAALAGAGPDPAPPRPLSLRALEWEHIQRVLAEHGGNVSAAARALGMHRRVLQRKLAKRAPPPRRGA